MSTRIVNGTGTLYDADGKQALAVVNYRLFETPQTEYTLGEWHGSFIPAEDTRKVFRGEYILVLQDKRKGKIIISHFKANSEGLFPRYYEFQGSGSLT